MEDITLSKISQSPKDKFCVIHLYEVPREIKFMEMECRMVAARGWRGEEMKSYWLMVIEVQFCKTEKFWRSGSQQCESIQH